eukprot:scaffold78728_cov57-Phaeocystis_antarctica.AAC.4
MYGYAFGAARANVSHIVRGDTMLYPGYEPRAGLMPTILHYGSDYTIVNEEGGSLITPKHGRSTYFNKMGHKELDLYACRDHNERAAQGTPCLPTSQAAAPCIPPATPCIPPATPCIQPATLCLAGALFFFDAPPPVVTAEGKPRSTRDILITQHLQLLNAAFCGFYRTHCGAQPAERCGCAWIAMSRARCSQPRLRHLPRDAAAAVACAARHGGTARPARAGARARCARPPAAPARAPKAGQGRAAEARGAARLRRGLHLLRCARALRPRPRCALGWRRPAGRGRVRRGRGRQCGRRGWSTKGSRRAAYEVQCGRRGGRGRCGWCGGRGWRGGWGRRGGHAAAQAVRRGGRGGVWRGARLPAAARAAAAG